MAYVSQEMKKSLAPTIKAILKKYSVKGSISVQNHSTLVVNLKEGAIDFIAQNTHYQVNEYHIESQWAGVAQTFLLELLEAMKGPTYFNEDDAMTDYFHRSHYTSINVGKWNKQYEVTV